MRSTPSNSGIELKPAPKTYSQEQDKARPPQDTVVWVKDRFQTMGDRVLRKTMRIDTGRLGIPVYLSLCGDVGTQLTGQKKQMGKGASPAQAEASALMELAERVSLFDFVRNTEFPLLTAPKADGPVMDFSQIAKSLHHPEGDLERAERVYNLLPQRWCWAKNLNTGRDEMVPLGWFFAINEYNGPSAGNCQEEALVQSLCEVVERHVSALVTKERRATPAIDPASVTHPVALELLQKYQDAGIKVYLKDFTSGMGIPTVAALCYDPATHPHKSEIVYTAGTASSPEQALIRALTEVAQLAGDFETGSSYKVSALPKFQSLDECGYITDAGETVGIDSLPNIRRDDFAQEVAAAVQALGQRGYTLYSLDVSHPGLQVPAVYSFIPGAHFAERTFGTDVVFHAAKLAAQLPNPSQALKVLEGMTQVAGDAYFLHFFKALAHIYLEQPQEGLMALDKALALNPPANDEASIHTQRGVALKDMGRFKEAKQALIKAAGFENPHHEVYNLLGFCHFKLEEYEQAVNVFGKAIEIEPGQAINYANIGVNLSRLGRIEEACRMYEHALDLDPALDWAKGNLDELRQSLKK